jgi:DNA-directed RNA polymerase specialized sigma24 family protein
LIKSGQSFSIKDFTEICSNPKSALHENAWREFLRDYKIFIYQNVTRYCYNWRIPRLRRQLSDVVNDIVAEVYLVLCRSLASYREVADEKKFKLWLATICSRTVSRYIQREFVPMIAGPDFEEFQEFLFELPNDHRWELYESVVDVLRRSNTAKKRNDERDINIFLLYVWADFNNEMILAHPCYKKLGHRVIDNVANRMRNLLR